jgi:Sec-independent protein translocase protein TatA
MGQAVGKTIREFRKASTDVSEAVSLEPQTKPQDTTPPNTLRGEATPNTISQDVAAAPSAEARRDDH